MLRIFLCITEVRRNGWVEGDILSVFFSINKEIMDSSQLWFFEIVEVELSVVNVKVF